MSEQQSQESRPSAAERGEALIDRLLEEGAIRSPLVEAAFRAVPRHIFLPGHPLDIVYRNEAIITKREGGMPVSSSSQPSMMAIMLEQLDLRPGHRVMEIGTATGYNAALMAHIVGAGGSIVTLDIDAELTATAREHLDAAGFSDVKVITRDGAFGDPAGAPYDRIIVTVGAWDIPPAWLEQLARDGRLVLPMVLAGESQESIAFERQGDHLVAVSHRGCGFVHMQGAFARPEDVEIPIDSIADLRIRLGAGEELRAEPAAIGALLRESFGDLETGVTMTERDLYGRLMRWLGFAASDLHMLTATGSSADLDFLPYLFGRAGAFRASIGVIDPEGLAFLIRRPGEALPDERPERRPERHPEREEQVELWVRSYGRDERPARRLIGELLRWERAGRPSFTEGLAIEAYPAGSIYHRSPEDYVITREHVTIVMKKSDAGRRRSSE